LGDKADLLIDRRVKIWYAEFPGTTESVLRAYPILVLDYNFNVKPELKNHTYFIKFHGKYYKDVSVYFLLIFSNIFLVIVFIKFILRSKGENYGEF